MRSSGLLHLGHARQILYQGKDFREAPSRSGCFAVQGASPRQQYLQGDSWSLAGKLLEAYWSFFALRNFAVAYSA